MQASQLANESEAHAAAAAQRDALAAQHADALDMARELEAQLAATELQLHQALEKAKVHAHA